MCQKCIEPNGSMRTRSPGKRSGSSLSTVSPPSSTWPSSRENLSAIPATVDIWPECGWNPAMWAAASPKSVSSWSSRWAASSWCRTLWSSPCRKPVKKSFVEAEFFFPQLKAGFKPWKIIFTSRFWHSSFWKKLRSKFPSFSTQNNFPFLPHTEKTAIRHGIDRYVFRSTIQVGAFQRPHQWIFGNG